MAITYFPFNSVIVNNKPDRAANAETMALYLKTFFTDGIVLDTSAAMQVKAKSGLTVAIQPGTAFVDGRIMHSSAVENFTLDDASGVLNRIDRIILRLDYANRLMKFLVLKGEEGSEPTAPAITRSADIYDMCLAEVYIGATVTELTQANITDKRADTTVCGIAGAAITQLDTSTMYEQFTAQFEEAYDSFSAQISESFDNLTTWVNDQKAIIENMIASLQAQGFENAAVYTSATMAAASWDQTEKTYSFEATYPVANYNIFIQPTKPCTVEQLEAWGAAMIIGDKDTNVYTAIGDVPIVDIPITIRAVKK